MECTGSDQPSNTPPSKQILDGEASWMERWMEKGMKVPRAKMTTRDEGEATLLKIFYAALPHGPPL